MTSFSFMLTVCPETFSFFDKVVENCPDFLQYGRRIFLVSSATKNLPDKRSAYSYPGDFLYL
jgi:hypothetical protein